MTRRGGTEGAREGVGRLARGAAAGMVAAALLCPPVPALAGAPGPGVALDGGARAVAGGPASDVAGSGGGSAEEDGLPEGDSASGIEGAVRVDDGLGERAGAVSDDAPGGSDGGAVGAPGDSAPASRRAKAALAGPALVRLAPASLAEARIEAARERAAAVATSEGARAIACVAGCLLGASAAVAFAAGVAVFAQGGTPRRVGVTTGRKAEHHARYRT